MVQSPLLFFSASEILCCTGTTLSLNLFFVSDKNIYMYIKIHGHIVLSACNKTVLLYAEMSKLLLYSNAKEGFRKSAHKKCLLLQTTEIPFV